MKPYPMYKESGVEFLNRIPEHWEKRRFGFMVNFNKGLNITKADLRDAGIPCVSYGEVHSKFGFAVNPDKHALRYVEEKYLAESPRSLLAEGDFVFADTSEDIEGAGNFTYLNSSTRAFAGYHTIIARATKPILTRFMAYQLDAMPNRAQIQNRVSGIKVFSISQGILKNVILFLPPLSEQRAIAAYLDRETAKIDSLIAKQEQMIALLEEKRQALISHTVTKGLNPKLKMKDSGIEWLGDIPEHWSVNRFGQISSIVRGGSPRPAGSPELFNGDYMPWVTVAEITKDEDIYLTSTATSLTKLGSTQSRIFKRGTLLLSNSGATLGVPKILDIDANANDGVVGFEKLSESFNILFCYYFLSSLTGNLRERTKQGSGQPNLNTEIVKAITIPKPPRAEQDAIVESLQADLHKLSDIKRKAQSGIELLKEKRNALISMVVTGKFDIRNEVNGENLSA